MGRPLPLDKESDIYVQQPTIHEIVDLGEDGFNELVMPYILTSEAVFNGVDGSEELMSRFDIYDLFFTKVEENVFVLDNVFGGKSALGVLKESLRFFLKTDDIEFLPHVRKIAINSKYVMDKKEFMQVRKLIQGVCNRQDMSVEKPPNNMTERQKGIWKKLQKGRRRRAEKDAVYLQDMINYISFGGTTYIPLDEIDRMKYYQLTNAYKSIMGKDAFHIGMGYKLSQKFDIKDDVKHWVEALKIGK